MTNEISARMVGDLREQTGAGLMDCKKALVESCGDAEKAILILKKKGAASALKKLGREASEGIIESYIHMGRVGVLLELNCETDFVAKNAQFHALAKDLCMHIAAANPLHISAEDVPEEMLTKEREIAAGQITGKPAAVIETIVKGKIEKFLAGICLMNQSFVKNPEVSIRDLINENISKIGENIRVGRFTRYEIGA